MNRLRLAGVLAVLVVLGAQPARAESMEAGKAFTKGTRGLINLVTGWVEIPKRIHETTIESGAAAGFTWGLLRGLGRGFIRTAAGAYELVTFPFPAPLPSSNPPRTPISPSTVTPRLCAASTAARVTLTL
jgi:putative exosortase-associated protein (TIGR04073 family)